MGAAFDPFKGSVERRVKKVETADNVSLNLDFFGRGTILVAQSYTVFWDPTLDGYEVRPRSGYPRIVVVERLGVWRCSLDGYAAKCRHIAAVLMNFGSPSERGNYGRAVIGGDHTHNNESSDSEHVEGNGEGGWIDIDDNPEESSTSLPSPQPLPIIPTLPTTSNIPSPDDPMFMVDGEPPFPEWVTEFRAHQWDACQEIMEAYKNEKRVVWLEAPTGAGKTLIGEMVRRRLANTWQDDTAWYVCTTLSLQEQFARDFSYAKVLKGRRNYPTLNMPYPEYTTADCTKEGGEEPKCYWCNEVWNCPYERAKGDALNSNLGILNTAYLLAEGNNVGKTRGRGLVIADEADTLEGQLMGVVQFEITKQRLERLNLEAPRKSVRKKTILGWLQDHLVPRIAENLRTLPKDSSDLKVIREAAALNNLLGETSRIIRDLTYEVEVVGQDSDQEGNWVRDNGAGPLVLKPVKVDRYGDQMLWHLGQRWLCMSATIISVDEVNESLGVHAAGIETARVDAPMTFPTENAASSSSTVQSRKKPYGQESSPLGACPLPFSPPLPSSAMLLLYPPSA